MINTKYMKINLFAIRHIILSIALFTAFGCRKYDDFISNDFDYTAVYFAHQQMSRTFVSDEWMQIGVGVMHGGKLVNDVKEVITLELSDQLIEPTSFTRLPNEYFTLVDAQGNPTTTIEILPENNQGFLYVKVNEAFLRDQRALSDHYALGFKIAESTTDSILVDRTETVVSFKYVNRYFGSYYREGTTTSYLDNGNSPDTVFTYHKHTPNNPAWELLTLSPDTSTTQWSSPTGITPQLNLVVTSDNQVTVIGLNQNPDATNPGTITNILDDGAGEYDPKSRTFSINYTYTFIDALGIRRTNKVNDRLVFRNRVIDGVNQWFE